MGAMALLGPSLRRSKVRERPARRVAAATAASLALNAAVLLLLARAGAFQLGPPREAKQFTLAPISADRWAANRAIHPPAAAKDRAAPAPFSMPKRPPQPPPEPPREAKGQIVDVAPSKDRTPPRSTPFLAEHDSTVDRETRSRHARPGYERTLPVPSAPERQTAPAPGQDGGAERAAPGVAGRPAGPAGAPKVAMAPGSNGDLAVPRDAPDGSAPAPGEGEGGQLRAGPSERLQLAPGTLARIAGGPAPDHLDGVEEGEGTYLNTRAFKYASYFNRIKQAVAATWDPVSPLDARDPDHSLYGHKDRFTLLAVVLDDSGRLKNLQVEQTSGIEFLDRAALSAFEHAQPFMNPPRGIVDARGEIRFSFGFFLDLRGSGLRIFRTPMPGGG
jgi:TonB family protein